MNLFKSILILLISLLLFTCSNSNNPQLEKPVEKPTSPPILEMSQELIGLWDVNGEILNFRLYENGFIEYETLDNDKKVAEKINKTEDIKIKKQSPINEKDVGELLNLLSSNEFLTLENNYKPKRSCVDNFLSNVIRFQYKDKNKIIKINGHCEDLANPDLENFPSFPSVLSNLYKRIGKITSLAAHKT